jgi:hypothetical protein
VYNYWFTKELYDVGFDYAEHGPYPRDISGYLSFKKYVGIFYPGKTKISSEPIEGKPFEYVVSLSDSKDNGYSIVLTKPSIALDVARQTAEGRTYRLADGTSVCVGIVRDI